MGTRERRGGKRKLVFIYLEMSEMRVMIIYLIPSLLVLVQCKMEVCVCVLFHFKVKIQSGLLLEKYVIFEEEVRWV